MKTDKGILLLITLIFLIILPFFYLHQGLLLIDTGREFFIPSQILNGGVLFKDIFNIYGALSYQFNALIFIIFGQRLETLAITGVLNSFLIIITLYLLAREFLNKRISFLFTLFIMFSLVFRTFLYNSNMPYSFAIVYALSSFLLSLLFLIKYTKNNKPVFAYFACFFAGISIANKYEFLLYLGVLIYALKDLGIKNSLKAFCCFCLVPLISYGTLIFQGLKPDDIKLSAELISNLINAPLIKQFFIKTSFTVFNSGIFSVFAFFPVINIILLILWRKTILKNKVLFVFILSAITAGAKSFLVLNVNHMGVFLLPVCTLALILMLKIKYQKALPFILTAFILIFAADDFNSLKAKDYFLITDKGNINTYTKDGKLTEAAIGLVFDNTNSQDRVVVLPEGSIINFITDRKGDNTYYNLSPLFYYDVFGEERVLKHFKENLPEYFLILPIDNREYGYSFFGRDYAQKFNEIILENYNLIQEKNQIKMFKKINNLL